MAKRYSDDTKALARALFIKRVKVSDISRETGVPVRTLYDWIIKDNWENLVKVDDISEAYDRRILTLLNKTDPLTGPELNEIDRLQDLKAKHLKVSRQIAAVTLPGDADPVASTAHALQGQLTLDAADQHQSEQPKKKKGRQVKNDFRGVDREQLLDWAKKKLFRYQWQELEKLLNDPNNETTRRRFYLKSRQIGWTFYAACEAFVMTLLSGESVAFLSASKNQSGLFRRYIAAFAMECFQVDLKGRDEITIQTDKGPATFWFLSTNSSTSQGQSGHVYLDEVFWIRDFQKLNELAGAIATHSHFRKTYFSTPSTKSHPAYSLWSGEDYQKIQEARPEYPVFKMPTPKQLKAGHLAADGMYRRIITIHDAMAGGATFFSLKQLELENLPAVFKQLYECEFIDDQNSAFVLDQLLGCAANDDRWHGFKSDAARPYGNRPVAIGYDPSRSGDKAEVVVLAIPAKAGSKFTLLERLSMQGMSWDYQADAIHALVKKYNVVHLAVDRTGEGSGVYEQVLKFFPMAVGIHYSVDTKIQLVLKAQSVIHNRRIQWSADHTDIPMAFMAIRRQQQGGAITFVAARDAKIGHADVAWAIMHALQCESLTSNTPDDNTSTWAISEAA